ncbi:hypothetical protein CERSUDRAFT_72480 [Gelatoporia subvermispora B]|uniref:Uncharacterized protein n=1 Tax=Ceriporiopsis subvermispora (strain B) TaxID=914234 RepID=M2QQF8_CERS8|nr:hypothetical protein CERSUDRAFT_72480 [Gelatoporia subvermispora B]
MAISHVLRLRLSIMLISHGRSRRAKNANYAGFHFSTTGARIGGYMPPVLLPVQVPHCAIGDPHCDTWLWGPFALPQPPRRVTYSVYAQTEARTCCRRRQELETPQGDRRERGHGHLARGWAQLQDELTMTGVDTAIGIKAVLDRKDAVTAGDVTRLTL